MSELIILAMPLCGGLLLGGFFFGGLWWTVIKGLTSPRPALWFFGSMLVRMSVILTGFYLIGREDWRRWMMCLLGTALARVVVKRVTRPPLEHQNVHELEARCAP